MMGMMYKRIMYFAVLLLMTTSCSGELEPGEYVAWVEDYKNGLHVKKPLGDYVFDIQYKPADYIGLQRGSDELKEGRENIDNLQYFTLKLSMKDGSADIISHDAYNKAEIQKRLYYFSYSFQNDIYMEENGVRLPCQLFHFERSYDLKPGRTFVMAFENRFPSSTAARLVINSKLLQTGAVNFEINKKDIPQLKRQI